MTRWITILLVFFWSLSVWAQNDKTTSLNFKGQAIGYTHYNPSNAQQLWLGARYIPQMNAGIQLKNTGMIDFEASANLYGNLALADFSNVETDGDLKPYRLWARYSNKQLEVRAGLQKINFGSASMLRPLMWFDQIDPRDPLKLTDGVWGILGRYYFLNNANVWLWGLYGNQNTKGWEMSKTTEGKPEYGGRFQFPVPLGEAAISYHHRIASVQNPIMSVVSLQDVPENRFGIDVRIDWALGTWFEASWTNMDTNWGLYDNQEVFNLGLDYTFGIGSGLYVAVEQLVFAVEEKAFTLEDRYAFTLCSMSYPIGLFDNLTAIVYYDWNTKSTYNFLNYQHQFNNMSLYAIGYWNPSSDKYNIPLQGGSTQLFGGKGIQLMLVWNH